MARLRLHDANNRFGVNETSNNMRELIIVSRTTTWSHTDVAFAFVIHARGSLAYEF